MRMPRPSAETTDLLERLLAGDARVKIRKMFGPPCGFVQGNMCVGTFGRQLFVRLNVSDHAKATRIRGVHLFEPMPGRPMKEYVVLPPAVLGNPPLSKKWVRRSVDYASTLPPKKPSGRR
jgi:TfoX/Sxy family transcriptional regulator of competence genes